jgi:hypothetical protein
MADRGFDDDRTLGSVVEFVRREAVETAEVAASAGGVVTDPTAAVTRPR